MAQGPQGVEDAEKKALELGKTLAEDIKTRRDYAEQMATLEGNRKYFMGLVKRNPEWEHEYDHWNKLNWS